MRLNIRQLFEIPIPELIWTVCVRERDTHKERQIGERQIRNRLLKCSWLCTACIEVKQYKNIKHFKKQITVFNHLICPNKQQPNICFCHHAWTEKENWMHVKKKQKKNCSPLFWLFCKKERKRGLLLVKQIVFVTISKTDSRGTFQKVKHNI